MSDKIELWCGYPGENHVVHLDLTEQQLALVAQGVLITCPTHQADSVGKLPKETGKNTAS